MAFSNSSRVASSGKSGESSSFEDITASGGKGGYTVSEMIIGENNDTNISMASGGMRRISGWKSW